MQPNDWQAGSDAGLDQLFAGAYPELPPEPLTTAVMRTVRRSAARHRLRAGVIGSALVASSAVALATLIESMPRLLASVAAFRGSVSTAFATDLMASTQMYRVPVLVVLCCALAWPALARLVAR